MRRIDFPLKQCEFCRRTMRRKLYRVNGRPRLEKPKQYRARETCNFACMMALRARRDSERWRALVAERLLKNPPAAKSPFCSRCGLPFVRRSSTQTRCPYCRRNGGTTAVRFLRGKTGPRKAVRRVKHILTAWEKFREMTIPKDAPETQIVEMRNAFIAGAAQLFFLITTRLEPGLEATENDLGFMDAIATEIDEWAAAKLAEIKGGH